MTTMMQERPAVIKALGSCSYPNEVEPSQYPILVWTPDGVVMCKDDEEAKAKAHAYTTQTGLKAFVFSYLTHSQPVRTAAFA